MQHNQGKPVGKPAKPLEHEGLPRPKGELNRLSHVAVTHSIFANTVTGKRRAQTAKALAKEVPPRQGGHVRAKSELERLQHVPVEHSIFAVVKLSGTRSRNAKANVLVTPSEETSTSSEGDEVLSHGQLGGRADRRTPKYQDRSSLETESDHSVPEIGYDGDGGVQEVEDGIYEDEDTIIVKTW